MSVNIGTKPKTGMNIPSPASSDSTLQRPPISGPTRVLIDHAAGLFNSLAFLIRENGVRDVDLFDSDRINIRKALEEICKAFGIAANFPDEGIKFERLTRRDLKDMGFAVSKRKR